MKSVVKRGLTRSLLFSSQAVAPKSCGILVYRDLMSHENNVFEGLTCDGRLCKKSQSSLIYDF